MYHAIQPIHTSICLLLSLFLIVFTSSPAFKISLIFVLSSSSLLFFCIFLLQVYDAFNPTSFIFFRRRKKCRFCRWRIRPVSRVVSRVVSGRHGYGGRKRRVGVTEVRFRFIDLKKFTQQLGKI